jgi:hypothetical protein
LGKRTGVDMEIEVWSLGFGLGKEAWQSELLLELERHSSGCSLHGGSKPETGKRELTARRIRGYFEQVQHEFKWLGRSVCNGSGYRRDEWIHEASGGGLPTQTG